MMNTVMSMRAPYRLVYHLDRYLMHMWLITANCRNIPSLIMCASIREKAAWKQRRRGGRGHVYDIGGADVLLEEAAVLAEAGGEDIGLESAGRGEK